MTRVGTSSRPGAAGRLAWTLALFLLLLPATVVVAAGTTPPSVDEIIERFLRQAQVAADAEARHEISYHRRTRIEELADDGAVEQTRSKEHAVTNRAGVIRAVLVKVDDRDPSEREARSDRKTDSEARRESGRRRNGPDFLDEGLVRRFQYTLEGEEQIEGRRVYRLAYEPKPVAAGTGKDVDRILSLLHGHLWIDAEQYELVKVEARLRSALKLLGGIAGSLNRLDFAIIRRPVCDGHWANVLLTSQAEGRKLFSAFRARVLVEQDEFQVRPLPPAPGS